MAKDLTLIAKSKGEQCGEITLSWPENWKEAGSDEHGGKEFAFQMYHQGRVVHERAKLYPKSESSAKKIDKSFVYSTVLEATGSAETAAKAAGGWTPEDQDSQPDAASEEVA